MLGFQGVEAEGNFRRKRGMLGKEQLVLRDLFRG